MTNSTNDLILALGLDKTPRELPIPGERRTEYRSSVELMAICEFGEISSIECKIVDITNSGAQIVFDKSERIPINFELHIPRINALMKCKLIWKLENRVGVYFYN